MTLTYAETRDSEHLRLLTPAIDVFIDRYRHPAATKSTSPRQTLFFFPGGIASQLTRATRKFVDGVATPQTFDYEVVWVASDSFDGGARDLKMYRDSAGTFRDRGSRIIVADAAVSDSDGHTPHDGLIAWCASNNVDLFVLPWDWRRRLDETVNFFVGKFLPFFQARVLAAGCPDPLARFALVGHSLGGMIVNLILRGNDPIVANMTHAITVATPFYGYPGQVHRWFEGDDWFNGTNPPGVFKQEIMETIASLPSLYVVQLLDEATYRNSTTQSALAHDPDFPLAAYPSMDMTSPGVRADPYNPKTNGNLVRYPALTGFSPSELEYARLQVQQLTGPMEPHLLQKFYNIRGVRTENDGHTPMPNTIGSVSWDWIPTSFDSADPSPIVDGARVPGDDTQPAWSARLATNHPSRCITVRGRNIAHIFVMNDALVIDAIGSILCPPGAAMRARDIAQPEPASDDDVVEFLRWLSEHPGVGRTWRSFNHPELRNVVPRKFSNKLGAIMRRLLMDVMKRPAPKGLTAPEPPERNAAARKPAGGRRRGRSPKKKTR